MIWRKRKPQPSGTLPIDVRTALATATTTEEKLFRTARHRFEHALVLLRLHRDLELITGEESVTRALYLKQWATFASN